MANDDMTLFADEGMLELFRMEAEMHSAALESGIMDLEADPTASAKIEPLMRAAHSIKGAARIMGLDIAVKLAHVMEDLFSAAQEKKTVLDAHAIDVLLQGVDTFKRLSVVKADALASWLKDHEPEIVDLANRLAQILAGESPTVLAPAPSPGPSPSAPAPEPVAVAPPPSAPATPSAPSAVFADEGMLELFRMEAEMHSAALESGIMDLEADPTASAKIEPLMRAAHSIKGAARIMGLDIAVKLAHVMEDLFSAAQEKKTVLDAHAIDVLLQGVDTFKRLSVVKADALASWLNEHEPEIAALASQLAQILTGGQVSPVSPLPAPTAPQAASAIGPETAPTKEKPVHSGPAAGAPVGQAAAPHRMRAPREDSEPPGLREPGPAESDNAILVTADNLSRLVGLAGECLVESQALRTQVQDLYQLKFLLSELPRILEGVKVVSDKEDFLETCRDISSRAQRSAGKCREVLTRQIESFETYLLHWENLSNRLYNEAIATRMRPFRDGAHGFPRMVRDMARKLGKKIKLRITGEATKVDRDVLVKLEAPLTHILRNACDHGIESPQQRIAAGKPERGTIDLRIGHRAGMLSVTVTDDGKGIDPEQIRVRIVKRGMASADMARDLSEAELMDFLFLSGFTTAGAVTEVSGRGVGLDVVKNMVQEVQGTMKVHSTPGRGTTFQMDLPLTLSVIRTLLVEIAEEPYAFPLTRLDRVLLVPEENVLSIEDRQYIPFDGVNIGLVPAGQPLGLKSHPRESAGLPVVVVSDTLKQYGVVVDRLLGEVDMVVRPLDPRLGKVPNISAAAISEDGSPILIIDVDDLVRSIDYELTGGRIARIARGEGYTAEAAVKRILVVDDSITVREVERRLLENKGYQVEVAVDGMDGWNAVQSGKYDLVISDVDMPRMNGIELVKSIRKDPASRHLPIIILSYKDREEDRLKGLEAGASFYLTKSSFYDESFIKSVKDLIGEPH
mgnify:CR=1 FL=1